MKICVALLVIPFLLSACAKTSADSFAQAFMKNLQAGRHLAVQEALSKEMKQIAAFAGGVNDKSLNAYYRTGQIKSFRLTLIETTSTGRRYKVLVVDPAGKQNEDLLDVVQEEGHWRVSRF